MLIIKRALKNVRIHAPERSSPPQAVPCHDCTSCHNHYRKSSLLLISCIRFPLGQTFSIGIPVRAKFSHALLILSASTCAAFPPPVIEAWRTTLLNTKESPYNACCGVFRPSRVIPKQTYTYRPVHLAVPTSVWPAPLRRGGK